MATSGIGEQVRSWIDDEVRRHPGALGIVYGCEVTAGASKGTAGDVVHWLLLLTCPSPFLGKDHLACTVRVMAAIPSEAGVRSFARSSVSKMRATYDRLAAEAREGGEGKAFLPARLKGRLN